MAASESRRDTAQPPKESLQFPVLSRVFLQPYLPVSLKSSSSPSAYPQTTPAKTSLPHVTLTYATSLDSSLSLAPGTQTHLSGPQSKAMTHYLRSRHDAILVGVGTALADDPGLNCRITGVGGYGGKELIGQPRPIVLDPSARWKFNAESRVFRTARENRGKAPWIVVAQGNEEKMSLEQRKVLGSYGGKLLSIPQRKPEMEDPTGEASTEAETYAALDWQSLLDTLAQQDVYSLMVEGGGTVINDLLHPRNAQLVNSVIITIAPTYLGQGGVVVSPERKLDSQGKPTNAVRFKEVKWQPLGADVIMCGRVEV
ncbi:bacterial bifunctional deaminase-reductase [Xylona heveae TC161]|uniref:2,5-diamino-6-ribosylamino-4(3H)-pyrimidinone 5'-phosphate reductase n=1 Tax=Xylona heveae (strain CBS 132557 / TC161) TaxID=1328760 RepID=A0A165A619_XYLHT|nr:bacterial bifunctional deaminase-reductase [Xylona heveae TC161]KZF20001.1 bacterial bifunctional deaminase-reductase [Xylona heveae TC161]